MTEDAFWLIVISLFFYFLFCFFRAGLLLSEVNGKSIGEQKPLDVLRGSLQQVFKVPKVFMSWLINLLSDFLQSKEQRCGFVLLLVSLIVLILFGLLHHKLNCANCDFIPNRRSPFLYDLFFWLAVIGLILSIYGSKLKKIVIWIKGN